jgi:uncharacterized protein (TIGR00369 family)
MSPVPDREVPEFLALAQLEIEMARAPYHKFLDPRPVAADSESGTVTVSLKARPEFRRAEDSDDLHGGVIAALIDLTAHAAVAVRIGRPAPTVDLRIDYLRPAAGDLMATGKLLRAGRSLARADVEVRDARDLLVAVGRGVFSTLQLI